MSEINMNDYDTFDEYIGAVNNNLDYKDKAEYYLDRLTSRIKDEKSLGKVRTEVYNFIYANTLMDPDVKKHLLEMLESNYIDGSKLSNDILSYLNQNKLDKELMFNNNNEKVEEMKTDFVNRIDNNLNEVKVELTGDEQVVKDALTSEEDMDKLNTEVETVNDLLASSEEENLGLTTSDLQEAIESPEEGILVDKIEEQLEKRNRFKVTEEGSIEITGSLLDENDQNYTTMMIAGLVTSELNLDMYLSKDRKDNNDYKVTFGNLPVKNHPENSLAPEVISKINEIHNSYDSTIDYQRTLNNMDPTIATLNGIIFNNVNEDGTIKVGINNHDGNYVIGLNMSSEYQELADAFSTNGATVTMDINENSVVKLDGDKLEQFNVLNNTEATLENEKVEAQQKTNNYQYIKKMEIPNSEAAKVSPYFLIVVAIAEVLLIASYIGLILIKK